MSVTIEKEGSTLRIIVHHPRLDGENQILNEIKKGNYFSPDIQLVELDFDRVEYINSLGISEIINIHRNFSDASGGKAKFRFKNLDRKVLAILELVEIQKIAEILPKPI